MEVETEKKNKLKRADNDNKRMREWTICIIYEEHKFEICLPLPAPSWVSMMAFARRGVYFDDPFPAFTR
jgi:hypothetical protein